MYKSVKNVGNTINASDYQNIQKVPKTYEIQKVPKTTKST